MALKELMHRFFDFSRAQPPVPIAPGLYHYMREHDGAYSRLHLRVEPDGQGMLIANATASAQLTASGVVIAKELLDGDDNIEIMHDLKKRFRGATDAQLQTDVAKLESLIRQLINPGDDYPMFNLEDAAVSPYEAQLPTPLEADIPLTNLERLRPILDRVWQVGIPHVTILVPENPQAIELVGAVERAEDLGLICGVSGRATDLRQGSLLEALAMAGVDHVTALYASADPAIHNALLGENDHAACEQVFAQTQQLEVADVGQVPLVAATLDGLDQTLAALLELNMSNVSFFAIATEADLEKNEAIPAQAMRQVATQVEEDADEARVRYMWAAPVRRNPKQSLAFQVRQGPRCAGDVAVRIEADGSVIPPRGPHQVAGNILQDSWQAIWAHETFRHYRQRIEAPTRCNVCPGLTICAADCPQEAAGWSQGKMR